MVLIVVGLVSLAALVIGDWIAGIPERQIDRRLAISPRRNVRGVNPF